MRRSFAVSAVLASVLAGCATLPPARAVADVKSLAGEWVGTMTGRFWASSLAMVIKEDGTYVMVRSGGRPTAGTLSVSRGRLVFRGDDGRTGTLSSTKGTAGVCSEDRATTARRHSRSSRTHEP